MTNKVVEGDDVAARTAVDEGVQTAAPLAPKTDGDTAMEVDDLGALGAPEILFPGNAGMVPQLFEEECDEAPLCEEPCKTARKGALGTLGDMSKARPASTTDDLKDEAKADDEVTANLAATDRIKRATDSEVGPCCQSGGVPNGRGLPRVVELC